MSIAKELLTNMNEAVAQLERDKQELINKYDVVIRDKRKEYMDVIRSVCKHEDGEKYVDNFNYHNGEDRSYYECVICQQKLREE